MFYNLLEYNKEHVHYLRVINQFAYLYFKSLFGYIIYCILGTVTVMTGICGARHYRAEVLDFRTG